MGDTNSIMDEDSNALSGLGVADNILLYGVPGCGNNNWSLCELITVVTYGFCRIDEDTGNLDLLVEIEDESGFGIDHDLHLKVNLYNEDEEIIYSGGEYIYEDDFDGYDTVRIHMEEDGLAFNAVRCKIYMTKG